MILESFFLDSFDSSIPLWTDKEEHDKPWIKTRTDWSKWSKRYNDRELQVRRIIRNDVDYNHTIRIMFSKAVITGISPGITKKEIKAIERILNRNYKSIELKSSAKNNRVYFVNRDGEN